MKRLRPYSKAVAAFLTTFAGSFGAALLDGHLERTEVLAALGVAIAATAGVYAAPKNQGA